MSSDATSITAVALLSLSLREHWRHATACGEDPEHCPDAAPRRMACRYVITPRGGFPPTSPAPGSWLVRATPEEIVQSGVVGTASFEAAYRCEGPRARAVSLADAAVEPWPVWYFDGDGDMLLADVDEVPPPARVCAHRFELRCSDGGSGCAQSHGQPTPHGPPDPSSAFLADACRRCYAALVRRCADCGATRAP